MKAVDKEYSTLKSDTHGSTVMKLCSWPHYHIHEIFKLMLPEMGTLNYTKLNIVFEKIVNECFVTSAYTNFTHQLFYTEWLQCSFQRSFLNNSRPRL